MYYIFFILANLYYFFLQIPRIFFSTLHSTLYTLHPTLHTLHPPLYALHPTLYTLRSTLYTLHSTLYTLRSTLYTLRSTLYTLPFERFFSRALRVGANLIRVQSVRSVGPIRLLELIPKVFIVLVFLGLFG